MGNNGQSFYFFTNPACLQYHRKTLHLKSNLILKCLARDNPALYAFALPFFGWLIVAERGRVPWSCVGDARGRKPTGPVRMGLRKACGDGSQQSQARRRMHLPGGNTNARGYGLANAIKS